MYILVGSVLHELTWADGLCVIGWGGSGIRILEIGKRDTLGAGRYARVIDCD